MFYEKVLEIVSSKIEEEKEFLNYVSQEIWRVPEIQYEEFHAHDVLTRALSRYGFEVQKQYILPTAFRAEYESQSDGGATIAILLEYDAVPEMGHACGRNLVAEAGLAASIGIKAVMDADPKLALKLIVLGMPAEEGGGKLKMIEGGAFENIDAAFMVHPANYTAAFPPCFGVVKGIVEYKKNREKILENGDALDAAFTCFRNISFLKNQIMPRDRFHTKVTAAGFVGNAINPTYSRLELYVRAVTDGELKDLQSRVVSCITKAAEATECDVDYHFESTSYKNLLTNWLLGHLFQQVGEDCGLNFHADNICEKFACCTHMGNISQIVPSIHPYFRIGGGSNFYTKEFTEASGSPEAQGPTLAAAKAMALTALEMILQPKNLCSVKAGLKSDIEYDSMKKLRPLPKNRNEL